MRHSNAASLVVLMAVCGGCAIGDPFDDLPPEPSGSEDDTGSGEDDTGPTTFTTSSTSSSTTTTTSTTGEDDTGGDDHQPTCDQAACICQGSVPDCGPLDAPCEPEEYCAAQCVVERGACDEECYEGTWSWTVADDACTQWPPDPTDPSDPTGNTSASGGNQCTDLSYCLNINVVTDVTNPSPCPDLEVGIGANNECDQAIYCGIVGWQPTNNNPQGYYSLEFGPLHHEPSIILWCSDTANQVGSTYRCSAPGEPNECWEPF